MLANDTFHIAVLPGDGIGIEVTAPALAVLAGLPRMSGNPFVIVGHIRGAHLVNIEKPWRAIRKAAELDGVRIHDLRHAHASMAVAGGESVSMLSERCLAILKR